MIATPHHSAVPKTCQLAREALVPMIKHTSIALLIVEKPGLISEQVFLFIERSRRTTIPCYRAQCGSAYLQLSLRQERHLFDTALLSLGLGRSDDAQQPDPAIQPD